MTTVTRLKRKARRVAKQTPLLRGVLRRYDNARKAANPAPAKTPARPAAAKKAAPKKPAGKPVDFGTLVATLAGARWIGPTTYELTGWVYGSKVAATLNPPKLRVWLTGPDGSKINTTVEQRSDLRANTTAADGKLDRAGAGFRAVVDLAPLLTGDATELAVRCALTKGPTTVEGALTGRLGTGSAGSLVPSAPVPAEDSGPRYIEPVWKDPSKDSANPSTGSGSGLSFARRDGEPAVVSPAPVMITEWAVVDPGSPRIRAAGWVAEDVEPDDLVFELRGPLGSVPGTVEWKRRGFTLEIGLQASFWNGPVAPLSIGMYKLWAGTGTDPVAVRLAPEPIADLPTEFESTKLNATLTRTGKDVPSVHVDPPLRADEAGPYAFARQQTRYWNTPSTLDGSVYFESFYGRSATDSPRAIHEELVRRGTDRTLYWTVADYSVQLPEGATPLLWRSREWFEVLSQASYFFHNCGAPIPLRKHKRPGQTVVQTWHGTPLKLLGNDRPVNRDRANYKKIQVGLSSDWDYLLAQNTYAAEIFRDAYFYDGPLLELGYPRNDTLATTSADEVARIRAGLGIAPDKKVVLYAPTWRDGEGHIVGYLDLEWLTRQLGPDYVFLLRGHTNSLRPRRARLRYQHHRRDLAPAAERSAVGRRHRDHRLLVDHVRLHGDREADPVLRARLRRLPGSASWALLRPRGQRARAGPLQQGGPGRVAAVGRPAAHRARRRVRRLGGQVQSARRRSGRRARGGRRVRRIEVVGSLRGAPRGIERGSSPFAVERR